MLAQNPWNLKINNMHSLSGIIRMNRKAAEKALSEDNHSRHCSFCGNVDAGVVLHSAKLRNTVFLGAGKVASDFLASWWSRNSQESRDALVESYFQGGRV